MRQFCLILCISLLSSLFHAVAMPVETFNPATAAAVAAHAHHACDEAPATTSSPVKPCKLSGHLCCLGITAAIRLDVRAAAYGAELFNPVFQTLALQDRPNPQFKPPRADSPKLIDPRPF